jgi:hypothetical protein
MNVACRSGGGPGTQGGVQREAASCGAHAAPQVLGRCGDGLQDFAAHCKVSLAQCASASPCERNWSAYEFVHSRKAIVFGAEAQQLVYVL